MSVFAFKLRSLFRNLQTVSMIYLPIFDVTSQLSFLFLTTIEHILHGNGFPQTLKHDIPAILSTIKAAALNPNALCRTCDGIAE